MAFSEEAVRTEIHALAEMLRADLPQLSRDLAIAVIALEKSLAEDQSLVDLLVASAEGNLVTVAHVLEHEVDSGEVDAPLAALHFARRLAQRGIPVSVLARAYRLGQQNLMAYFHQKLELRLTSLGLALETYRLLTEVAFAYADRVTEQAIVAYEGEVRIWLRSTAASQTARIQALLAGAAIDVPALEQSLSYKLNRSHVGITIWIPGDAETDSPLAEIERIAARIAKRVALDARPLFVARDESCAFVWLPFDDQTADLAKLTATAGPLLGDHVRIAMGNPERGPEGFRTTMRQALTAQEVVLRAATTAPRVVPYADVAPISMLPHDLDLTRSWVRGVLGPLADDDDHAAGFRQTLQVFLAASGNLRETAHRLFVHKNTVTYRIRKAEELRGKPLVEDRMQLELALLACHWLGSAVLTPPAGR